MKAKKIILTLAFALLMLGLKAQDKYEYATVIYRWAGKDKAMIETSIGDKYTETQVTIIQYKVYEDLTPVISFINKMSNEGWEVYANSTGTIINEHRVYYFLKRKK